MTECERLIANGTFTRDFFKPEVRCMPAPSACSSSPVPTLTPFDKKEDL